jgi:hypothetical protein
MTRRTATGTDDAATVNLLSPWVFEELRVHRLRQRFVVAGIGLAVLLGLVWTGLELNLHAAEAELRGEQATTTGLTAQMKDLAPVKTYVNGVIHRVATVHSATYDDVAFSQVLSSLNDATPDDATLTSISVDLAAETATAPSTGTAAGATAAPDTKKDPARGLSGSSCPGPDPFGTKVVVGCVTIEGTAADREAVGKLVIALGDTGLFVEPFVNTTTTSDGDGVSFAGSVGLSPKVFSGRFDDLGAELAKENSQ